MRVRNPNVDRATDAVLGRVSPRTAGSRGIVIRDSSTEAHPVRDLTVIGGTITDNDDGTAVLTIGTAGGIPGGQYETTSQGGRSIIDSHGNLGATEDIDPDQGNVHFGTLNANCIVTLLQPSHADGVTLEAWIQQDGTGGWSLAFSAGAGTFTWDNSVTPTIPAAANAAFRVILERTPGSTNDWIGNLVGSAAASSTSTAVSHAHVVSETHLSNGSTTTWTLDQFFEPGSVIAWNTTTLARLGVTEVEPDQATVSAAGTTGDSIVFDYAATLA